MRSSILVGAAAALVLPLTGHPAVADTPDGNAVVTLPACGQSTPIGTEAVPDCSYIALPAASGGVYYAHLTSQGAISWRGTARQGGLTFPVEGQTWPGLSLLDSVVTATAKPSDITGTVAPDGTVNLTLKYDTTVGALGLSCTAKGQVLLSSTATDPVGGGQGRGWDPQTGRFAVAATSASVPVLAGPACLQAGDFLDLSKGLGWYVSGTLTVDPGPVAPPARQKARVKLPKRVAGKGKTVILRKAVVTNAGQRADVDLTWGTKRSAKGTKKRYAKVRTTKSGKVILRTRGKAKRLYVRLRLSAPATPDYEAYARTKKWRTR